MPAYCRNIPYLILAQRFRFSLFMIHFNEQAVVTDAHDANWVCFMRSHWSRSRMVSAMSSGCGVLPRKL